MAAIRLEFVLNLSTIVLDMRTKRDALADVLFGQTHGGILGLLYGHPDQSFYVRQIARQVGISVGTVQRELEKLAQVGLIVRSESGNQVFYQANPNSPVFPEIRALVAKTVGAFRVLRSALEPLSKQIAVAFVYGSMARQEEKAESDIDLMMVGEVSLDDVLAHLSGVESILARPVNPTVYTADEFRLKITSGNYFLNAVLQGKIVFLFGDEDELGKMGGDRVVEARTHQPR